MKELIRFSLAGMFVLVLAACGSDDAEHLHDQRDDAAHDAGSDSMTEAAEGHEHGPGSHTHETNEAEPPTEAFYGDEAPASDDSGEHTHADSDQSHTHGQ